MQRMAGVQAQIRWSSIWLVLLSVTLHRVRNIEISVKPRHCICPDEIYTCHVSLATEIQWITNRTGDNDFEYSVTDGDNEPFQETDGFRVTFTNERATVDFDNLTSTLLITDLAVNETDLTCRGTAVLKRDNIMTIYNIIRICVVGSATSPTDLSVVWDSSSAVVSFHPPVYGVECVDYYVVTAVSEERNVPCHATSDELTHNCSIPPDSNVNDYNFTVYSVTRGIDGALYNGSTATDCNLPFPENVATVEVECGLQRLINVSWQYSRLPSVHAIILWYNSSGDIHLEIVNAEFAEYLLNLIYSVTGLLEIAVTFSSGVCNKTSVTQYHVEDVLTSVSVSSTTLIIESRDCIGSGEEYRIVATFTNTSTELVNVPFTSISEHDLGDRVMDNTEYSITVRVVDMTSGTVIDERTVTFTTPPPEPDMTSGTVIDERTVTFTTPSEPDMTSGTVIDERTVTFTTPSEPGVTEAVIPNTGDTTTYIAVGVGGGLGLLVVGLVLCYWL